MAAKAGKEYRFLLVGKSGSGKSCTANNIMGEKMFQVSTGLAAGTKTCEARKSSKPKKGVTFMIVDTPGLFDPTKSNKEISDQIVKAATLLHPGLHAILYIVQVGRYTPEERDTFQLLKDLFDTNVVKYIIIIFTKGDELKRNKMSLETLLEGADEPFKEVLRECGRRVLVFNNWKYDQKYTKELLQMVDKILKENGEVPYTCAFQNVVNEHLEKRATVRAKERIEKDPSLMKAFDEMAEDVRKAQKEAQDQTERVQDTQIKQQKTEEMIAEKTAAREREEREKKEREKEERERQERAEKEMKDLQEKKKREDEERKRKEEEREAEEKERKEREKEIEELKKQNENLKKEQEMNKKIEEEKLKLQEQYEQKLKEEKERIEKEEMEKTKRDIAEDKEKHWTQKVLNGAADAVGGVWKAWRGFWG